MIAKSSIGEPSALRRATTAAASRPKLSARLGTSLSMATIDLWFPPWLF